MLGFQVSRGHPAIPAKEAPPAYRGVRGSPGLQAAQVTLVGKDSEEMRGLLDQLE